MLEWVVKICIAAILFTIVSYILPKSNIRNASTLALSFVFLSVLIMPLSDFTTEIISQKIMLETEKNEIVNQAQNNSAEYQVMEHYKSRIKEEIEKALKERKYVCKDIIVTVDENMSSESFAQILSVALSLSEKREEKEDASINKIEVPNIVIDKHGIKIEKKEDESNSDMKEYENEIKDVIFELTGTDKNKIMIRWSK